MVTSLLPEIKVEEGKVVVVSSWHGQAWFASGGVPKPLDELTFGMFRSYGDTKLANLQFAFELAKRNKKLKVASVHPGMVHTPLGTSRVDGILATLERWGSAGFWSLLSPITKTVEQGAATQVYALLNPSIGSNSTHTSASRRRAQFLSDMVVDTPTPDSQNPKFTNALWEHSSMLVKNALA